jgi:hypothetical protein
VTDETSDFAQAFFNTSGSSGDTMTLAISATKAWVTASLATHPTCVENGTIRFRFNFIASSGIFQVYAVRFRYTLPKEAPSF